LNEELGKIPESVPVSNFRDYTIFQIPPAGYGDGEKAENK